MKIALALSGGGFRATVFHLGVLARLALDGHMEDVGLLSTVSGGSLCAGLVFALNKLRWPTSSEYLSQVLPEARRLLITKDLQRSIIVRQLSMFWNIFETRADDLSSMMQKQWGVTAKLRDLPENPRWLINATCYETGKNWRFERFRMGDYVFGYTFDPDFLLADAVAASAGFPGLIGPLVLDTKRYQWSNYFDKQENVASLIDPDAQRIRERRPVTPDFPIVHLWDGGAYDNNGLEGLVDVQTGWRRGVEFLIVSDGAGRAFPETYQRGAKALLRLATGIMMEQVRSLRARIVLERLINHSDHDKGAFLQIGNVGDEILARAGKESLIPQMAPTAVDRSNAQEALHMPTVIRKLSSDEFEMLFRHGFEVADTTLFAYHPNQFNCVGYANQHFAFSQ